MHRIELNRDAKVLDGFFQTPALLQQLVPKAVPPQKSLGILGHHLPERLKIHPALYQLSSLRKRWHFRKRFPSGFKVLVQHRYPGQSRNQGVAHGTISTLEPHGARRIESHVGSRVSSPSHGPGDGASFEHPVARADAPPDHADDVSGGPGPSARPALGSPPAHTTEARRSAPLAHGGLPPARAALVPRTDCSWAAAAVS